MRPSLVSPRRLCGADRVRSVSRICGPSGGCCPIGPAEYRTQVSNHRDYGRTCTIAATRAPLVHLQDVGEILPLQDENCVSGLVLVELLTMAVVFLDADEVLQTGLAMRDGGFDTADFFFQFADPVFHLLALDRIQTFGLARGGLFRGWM